MSVVYILLPVAACLAAVAVAAFIWAVRRGQFDDLDTPAIRILHEDEESPKRCKKGEPRIEHRSNTDKML
jgi:cbb3-type cytochrome oxidase maturation protein